MIDHDHGILHVDGHTSIAPVAETVITTNGDIGFQIANHLPERSDGTGPNRYCANRLLRWPDQLDMVLAKRSQLARHLFCQLCGGAWRDLVHTTVRLPGTFICRDTSIQLLFEPQESCPGIANANLWNAIPDIMTPDDRDPTLVGVVSAENPDSLQAILPD